MLPFNCSSICFAVLLTEHAVRPKIHASPLPISQLKTKKKNRNRNTSEALFKQLLVLFYSMQTIQYACLPARIRVVDSMMTLWRNNLFEEQTALISSPGVLISTLRHKPQTHILIWKDFLALPSSHSFFRPCCVCVSS